LGLSLFPSAIGSPSALLGPNGSKRPQHSGARTRGARSIVALICGPVAALSRQVFAEMLTFDRPATGMDDGSNGAF